MEKILNTEISDTDYIIGRKQLFYIFLHETMHAFITKKAPWIHDLPEDETDFVDELAVRIILDDLIIDLGIYEKIDIYFENHVCHKKEMKRYGFPLEENAYRQIKEIWKKDYYKGYKVNEFCRYVHKYYLDNSDNLHKMQ